MHKLCKDLPWLSALIPNLQPICLTDLQLSKIWGSSVYQGPTPLYHATPPPPRGETWVFFLRDPMCSAVLFFLFFFLLKTPWKLYVVAFSLDDCCNYNPSVI
ncbi:hypothetical protein V6Z12_D13G054000 [Gossypium hirsutum]